VWPNGDSQAGRGRGYVTRQPFCNRPGPDTEELSFFSGYLRARERRKKAPDDAGAFKLEIFRCDQ
jgi:hypothetical protein